MITKPFLQANCYYYKCETGLLSSVQRKSQGEIFHFILKAIRLLLQKEIIPKITVVTTHHILNSPVWSLRLFFPVSILKLKILPHNTAEQKTFTGLSFELERQNIAVSARVTAQNPN